MPDLEELPIAITMGDPCGIGPEIIAKLYADADPLPPTLVLGDERLIKRAIGLLDLPLTVRVIDAPEEFQLLSNTIHVISISRLPEDLPLGQLDSRAGKAAFDYIRAGIDLALQKRIRAIVTAPINKEALRLADIHYPGHTEILADFSGTKDFAMMLMNNDLRVILVTIHVSLREAIEKLTIESELTVIRLAHCDRSGCRTTRNAASDDGRFGGGAAIRDIPDSCPHLVSGADRQACRAVITVQPGGG
jgi:4-hydroxythreonine-4-phosphate dehydrogenase